MSERTTEAGFVQQAGIIEHTTREISDHLQELAASREAHRYRGELPLEDVSVESTFTATRNLMHAYRGSSENPDYPCVFYLANGNDLLGVRFKPGSDEGTVQIVANDEAVNSFKPLFELDEEGEVTALRKVDYAETRYETLSSEQAGEALEVIAYVVAATRWDHVFGSKLRGTHRAEMGAAALIEAGFEKRQKQITDAQANLDADRAFYEAMKQYYGPNLAKTLEMQARAVVDEVTVATVSENGENADKHVLLAELLTQFAQNVGAIALSDPGVSVQLRVFGGLHRPTAVDALKDPELQRFAGQYHSIYNGVTDPSDS